MTERKKKLIRDIEALRESIRLAGPEFVRGNAEEPEATPETYRLVHDGTDRTGRSTCEYRRLRLSAPFCGGEHLHLLAATQRKRTATRLLQWAIAPRQGGAFLLTILMPRCLSVAGVDSFFCWP